MGISRSRSKNKNNDNYNLQQLILLKSLSDHRNNQNNNNQNFNGVPLTRDDFKFFMDTLLAGSVQRGNLRPQLNKERILGPRNNFGLGRRDNSLPLQFQDERPLAPRNNSGIDQRGNLMPRQQLNGDTVPGPKNNFAPCRKNNLRQMPSTNKKEEITTIKKNLSASKTNPEFLEYEITSSFTHKIRIKSNLATRTRTSSQGKNNKKLPLTVETNSVENN